MTLSRKFDLEDISATLPLSWSHYVRLVRSARSPEALDFYHAEALRGGWNVRQLDRQINSQSYERTALSRDKKNYAREHWTQPEENPPVGIILCSAKGDSLVRYSTEGLPNKTLVREYLHVLPDERILTQEIKKTRSLLEGKTRPVKRRKS